MIDFLDSVLTVLFWLPAKIIGYEKCSKCNIRFRRIQFLYYISLPIDRIPAVKYKRMIWGLKINPPTMDELVRVSPQEIGYVQ